MRAPKITLVTPSFDQARFLEQTIESVLDQRYPHLEYIVMDGGSTDGSVDIIKKYERHLAYWVSARDAGQTDAIVRGFARATGEVMNWLNSDDYLLPGALQRVADLVERNPGAGLYAAATESFIDGEVRPYDVSAPAGLTIAAMLGITGEPVERHQPGIFLCRSAYQAAGGLDPSFHFTMDYDLYLRMLEGGAEVVCDSTPIARFRSHRSSKTGGLRLNVERTVRELMRSADAAGRRTGLQPDHRQHLNTLCGGAVTALRRRQWDEARACLSLAWTIGNGTGIVGTYASAVARRVRRTLAA